MRKMILMLLVCAATAFVALAQSGSGAPGAEARDPRRESFEIVWRTVKEKHFDPTLGGVDWDAARRKYEPRAASVKNDGELHRLLNEMLGELRQSHFAVIPPEAMLEDGSLGATTGGIGIDLRVVDDLAIITRVAPGSAAARAGLRPGFVVKKIDGVATDELRKEIAARLGQRDLPASFKRYVVAQVWLRRIGGRPGAPVKLQYLDERDQTREATIEREKLAGELSQPFGYLPPVRTEFETKRLVGGLGYMRFNAFMMPVMEKVRAALREFKDAPGIVFDLRGNGGGLGGLAQGIAGWLATRPASLGTTRMRTGQMKLAVFPQASPYAGPVAVLIDGGSGSTTEIFAAGLQELRRAVIVGEPSAGMVLPSTFEKLPTGALFQYAHADFRTPSGVLIEGRGVAPDIEIKHNRASLLAGGDAQLDAAIEAAIKRGNAR